MLNPKIKFMGKDVTDDTTNKISSVIQERIETMLRNEAIADLLQFKQYLPSKEVEEAHKDHYPKVPVRWFYIPNVGRYNSFELRFNSDWNWMVSCIIELRKYRGTHKPYSELDSLFNLIASTKILDLDLKILWLEVSDYALAIINQKNQEKK